MDKECFECGSPAIQEHHVVPRSLGGTKTVPLCDKCHSIVHCSDSELSLARLQKAGSRKNRVTNLEICHKIYQDKGETGGVHLAEKLGVNYMVVYRVRNGEGQIVEDYERLRSMFHGDY